jgi:hypothetical protein
MPTLEPESLQIHRLLHISLRDDRDEASNSPPIQRAFAGSVAEEGVDGVRMSRTSFAGWRKSYKYARCKMTEYVGNPKVFISSTRSY